MHQLDEYLRQDHNDALCRTDESRSQRTYVVHNCLELHLTDYIINSLGITVVVRGVLSC